MAKQQDIRPIIKLRSTAGTGYTYVTRKNRRNNPDRLVLKKYDPVVRKHVDFRALRREARRAEEGARVAGFDRRAARGRSRGPAEAAPQRVAGSRPFA